MTKNVTIRMFTIIKHYNEKYNFTQRLSSRLLDVSAARLGETCTYTYVYIGLNCLRCALRKTRPARQERISH